MRFWANKHGIGVYTDTFKRYWALVWWPSPQLQLGPLALYGSVRPWRFWRNFELTSYRVPRQHIYGLGLLHFSWAWLL